MSSRWYPIYNRGNPQLRVFLPNFWMKLVKNKDVKMPPNKVSFQVSPQMTQIDVKNYLEKIYKVPVMNVKTFNVSGKTFLSPYNKVPDELFKDDDIKYAIVTMPKDFKFEYPDVTKNPEEEKQEKEYLNAIDKAKNNFKRDTGTSGGRRHGLPTFFGL